MKKIILWFCFFIILIVSGCQQEIPNIDEPDDDTSTSTDNEELSKEEIFKWLTEKYENYIIDKDFDYPKTYLDTNVRIELFSFEEEYLTNEGKYTAPILDYETEILFIVYMDDKEHELFLPVIFKGSGDIFDAIEAEINELIPDIFTTSINLPTYIPGYDCQIEWKSYDENIITSTGIITKDLKNEQITFLDYWIISNGEKRHYSKIVTVEAMSNTEKINLTIKWLEEKFKKIDIVDGNITLDKRCELYDTWIQWESWNPTVLSKSGVYNMPFNDEEVILEATVSVGVKSTKYRYNLKAKGENNEDIWVKIESFLDKINVKEIKNQKFYLYGYEEGYQRVPTQNIGYLPFYDGEEMEIIVDLLPDDSPLKPNTLRKTTKYIVIHNTGMAHPSATAKGLNEYIHTTTRVASWHFSIDDKETYQHLELDEVGWHAGDGSRTYLETWSGGIGGGNQNGIGIESCVYAGVDFNKVMRRLAKLTAMLMIQYDLNMQSIKQHYNFDSKDCPQVLRQSDRWNELLDLIRLEYFAQTQLQGVTFEWESLNPEIMDNEVTIINHPKVETEISYKVKVTYDGETREYTYKSTLLELKE